MSSPLLLDVNVLMALAWDTHPQFETAERWFLDRDADWATCPLTELGFVRLSANPALVRTAGSPAEALATLKSLRAVPGHCFWPDAHSVVDDAWATKLQGHNQFTDAYLLALAHRKKGRLATFDKAFVALADEAYGHSRDVLLIPATRTTAG